MYNFATFVKTCNYKIDALCLYFIREPICFLITTETQLINPGDRSQNGQISVDFEPSG